MIPLWLYGFSCMDLDVFQRSMIAVNGYGEDISLICAVIARNGVSLEIVEYVLCCLMAMRRFLIFQRIEMILWPG